MGCSSSTQVSNVIAKKVDIVYKFSSIDEVRQEDIQDAWNNVVNASSSKKKNKDQHKIVIRRTGWRTIRIFVSSTFKDFNNEREYLIKEVFGTLRIWCEKRRLNLVDIDLRWGVPKEANQEKKMRACLGEIDRCFSDNILPFFINMVSERNGWIPLGNDVPYAIRTEYEWIDTLSITEMEIMHAAYRIKNPNAIFMIRDSSFLTQVPEEHTAQFVDSLEIGPAKLNVLKEKIMERFGDSNQAHVYTCKYQGVNANGKVVLAGLEDFGHKVLEFFKKRIDQQYPLVEDNLDVWEKTTQAHEAFMKSLCEKVIGRDALVARVLAWLEKPSVKPYLMIAGPGVGKTALMARIADTIRQKAKLQQLPGNKKWSVLYHFVGAVPGSTDLHVLLCRILRALKAVPKDKLPANLDQSVGLTCSALSNKRANNTIIVIDAVNQLDEMLGGATMNWIPVKLSPNVKLIMTMIPDSAQYKAIGKVSGWTVERLKPLDKETKQEIVGKKLAEYNKELDEDQMKVLLKKKSSDNPLWLSLACEELRQYGDFRGLLDFIGGLNDGLLNLEKQILHRFEIDYGGELLIATLCLLEVSRHGLRETELLELLADEDDLLPPELIEQRQTSKKSANDVYMEAVEAEMKTEANADASATSQDSENNVPVIRPKSSGLKLTTDRALFSEKTIVEAGQPKPRRLAAKKWSEIFRALKPFLRPFGESGEGRLDFYHRSLSKAVRQKYFHSLDEDDSKKKAIYKFYQQKLANYFQHVPDLDRKIEEYPYHLVAIDDGSRLEAFLLDFDVFDKYYHEEFCRELAFFWKKVGNFDSYVDAYKNMADKFQEKLTEIMEEAKLSDEEICHRAFKFGWIMLQNGQFARLKDEDGLLHQLYEKYPNAQNDRSINSEFLYLNCKTLDEDLKTEEYMYKSQLPRIKNALLKFKEAIETLEVVQSRTERENRIFGYVLNRCAFYHSGINMRGGMPNFMDADTAKSEALVFIDRAIEHFRAMGDEINSADCLTTKGVCYGRACPQQIEFYEKARALFEEKVGTVHPCLDRLYLNMGIYYEDKGNYQKAFAFFKQWHDMLKQMFGVAHPKTQRSINILNEPMYQRFCRAINYEIPSPHTKEAKMEALSEGSASDHSDNDDDNQEEKADDETVPAVAA